MQELDGNLSPVALCGALVFALAMQGCAGGGGQVNMTGGAGGDPSGGGGTNAGGSGGGVTGQGGSGPGGGGSTGAGGGAGVGAGGTLGGGGGGVSDGGGSDAILAAGVHVQYKCTDSNPGPATSVPLDFLIRNQSPIPVDFSTFSLRYWFTSDNALGLSAHCETIQPGQQLSCTQVVTTIKPAVPPRATADSYLEVSLTPSATATGIGFGGAISQLTIRFQANGPFMQSNDYSFDPTIKTYADDPKVTAYSGGTLVWGVEP